MYAHDVVIAAPFLDREVIDVNMARAVSGYLVINHLDARLIINIEGRSFVLLAAELFEDEASILGFLSTGE